MRLPAWWLHFQTNYMRQFHQHSDPTVLAGEWSFKKMFQYVPGLCPHGSVTQQQAMVLCCLWCLELQGCSMDNQDPHLETRYAALCSCHFPSQLSEGRALAAAFLVRPAHSGWSAHCPSLRTYTPGSSKLILVSPIRTSVDKSVERVSCPIKNQAWTTDAVYNSTLNHRAVPESNQLSFKLCF